MNEAADYFLLGETIRQMRRKQSLTQTELGGEYFSKSYVSGVEHSKITPSYDAMHRFAEKLGLSFDYFEKFLPQPARASERNEDEKAEKYFEYSVQEKILSSLNILLKVSEEDSSTTKDFSLLLPDIPATLPSDIKGLYLFLLGLIAQQKKDFSAALPLLEQGLGLAPATYQVAILDALGNNYFALHAYYVALEYHTRALALLNQSDSKEREEGLTFSALLFKVEFHCGNDCYMVGAHRSACNHFETVRSLLKSTHDIQTAAKLYLRLGYSIYAYAYQRIALLPTAGSAATEIEHEFQRSLSYLIQSTTLYQVSSNRWGDTQARLFQAQVLLDLSMMHRKELQFNSASVKHVMLLDEAEEQCRQIVQSWEFNRQSPADNATISLYTSIAFLIHIYVQRASIAYKQNSAQSTEHNCSKAIQLCQNVLDLLQNANDQQELILKVLLFKHSTQENILSVLEVPEVLFLGDDHSLVEIIRRSVILFAAGEVLELLGKIAINKDNADACYKQADRCFVSSLAAFQIQFSHQLVDKSPLYRCYQRCVEILHERQQINSSIENVTQRLLEMSTRDLGNSYLLPL